MGVHILSLSPFSSESVTESCDGKLAGGGLGGRGYSGWRGVLRDITARGFLERFSVRGLFKDMYLAFEGRRNKECVCVWGGGGKG